MNTQTFKKAVELSKALAEDTYLLDKVNLSNMYSFSIVVGPGIHTIKLREELAAQCRQFLKQLLEKEIKEATKEFEEL